MLAAACRSAKERTLFMVALIFSSLVWLMLVVTLVGLLYAPFIAIAIVVAHAFFLARLTGNSLRVGSRQLPDLYKRIENAASKLGLERMPEVYVTTGGGILNAFATKLFSRTFIVLNSEILDACEKLDEGKGPNEPRAVDFIIGHELGHLALGHLSWNWLLWPSKLVPLLGPAYSRACEYSADATGLAACDDAETASRALAVLATGGNQARKVTIDALVEQRHDTGSFVMGIVELNSTHPYLSKRVAAVQRLRDGGMAPEIGRNPFSYLFAPMFAGASSFAAAYMAVAVVGILAAIAIPNFIKYQERAKANALGLNLDAPPPADPFGANVGLGGLGGVGNDAEQQKALQDLVKELEKAQATPPPADLFAGAGTEANPLGLGVGGLGTLGTAKLPEEAPEEEFIAPAPSFEARLWLKGQTVAKNKEAIANFPTVKAAAFVEKLYKAGAKKVYVNEVNVDEQGIFANEIIAEMPVKPALRKKLVDICTAEFAKQGYAEPCEDDGVAALYFTWE